ncbi:MAG: hypothetical protein KME31_15745 [Tolypothrix carrinoi HA7290-LM1]|nr:hypothetical protein [Tolypothrix carrinoi HA7290-LM1]
MTHDGRCVTVGRSDGRCFNGGNLRNALPPQRTASPMPHAPCPMPHAPCPMPNAQCPITNLMLAYLNAN